MQIVSISHVIRDMSGGASGSTLLLNDALRRQGHSVVEVFADDMTQVTRPRLARELIALHVAHRAMKFSRDADVIIVTGHAAWIAFPVLRALRRFRRNVKPLLVSKTYGLEHFDHRSRLEEHRTGRRRVSLAYRFGGGFVNLREVEISVRAADLFIAPRPNALRWAIVHQLKRADSCAPIGWGVRQDLNESDPNPSNAYQIAWLGTTVERKGWIDFIEGFAQATRHDQRLTAAVFGTRREPSEVAAEFPSDVRSKVTVFPLLAEGDLFRAVAVSACMVSASLSEGFHLALLQAMALGVPVIATREGFLADLAPTTGADLFLEIPRRSPSAIADAILEVVAPPNSNTARKTAERANRAWEFAGSQSWDAVATRALRAFSETSDNLRRHRAAH